MTALNQLLLTMLGSLLLAAGAAGQTATLGPSTPSVTQATPKVTVPDAPLKQFDLAFPGGTPSQLVRAVEQAFGTSLNVIISPEAAAMQLPAVRIKGIIASQSSQALQSATLQSLTAARSASSARTGLSALRLELDKPGRERHFCSPKIE